LGEQLLKPKTRRLSVCLSIENTTHRCDEDEKDNVKDKKSNFLTATIASQLASLCREANKTIDESQESAKRNEA